MAAKLEMMLRSFFIIDLKHHHYTTTIPYFLFSLKLIPILSSSDFLLSSYLLTVFTLQTTFTVLIPTIT